MKNQKGGLSDFVTGLWNRRAILDLWFKRKSNMSYGLIDGKRGHDCSASSSWVFCGKGFSPSHIFLFFLGMFSQRFSFLACSLGFFVHFFYCQSKAVRIATLCNVELGPLGYKNKVENYNSIYLEELSDTDHCCPLRIHEHMHFVWVACDLRAAPSRLSPWGFIDIRWGAGIEVKAPGWGISWHCQCKLQLRLWVILVVCKVFGNLLF